MGVDMDWIYELGDSHHKITTGRLEGDTVTFASGRIEPVDYIAATMLKKGEFVRVQGDAYGIQLTQIEELGIDRLPGDEVSFPPLFSKILRYLFGGFIRAAVDDWNGLRA